VDDRNALEIVDEFHLPTSHAYIGRPISPPPEGQANLLRRFSRLLLVVDTRSALAFRRLRSQAFLALSMPGGHVSLLKAELADPDLWSGANSGRAR
jgi:hypothetical protein